MNSRQPPAILATAIGPLLALPLFRVMLACLIVGGTALVIVNLFRRGTPCVSRVGLSLVFAYFLASPSLATYRYAPVDLPPATGCVLAFAIALSLAWFCIFRPGAIEDLQAKPPPSNRFFW